MFYAGAVSVPLSVKLEESNDLLFRMRHAEVKALFVSKHQLPKIRRIRAGLPKLEADHRPGHIPLEAGETAYGTLKRLGRDYLAEAQGGVLESGRRSGTTTTPRSPTRRARRPTPKASS